MMLPKGRRLRAAEVTAILREGKSLRATSVSAKYRSYTGPGRAAIVVSKKVARLATTRNKLRRTGYQALPPLPRGVQIIFFIQKPDFQTADILLLCSKLS